MKRQKKPELTAGQMEIMDIVWERGEVGVAEVWKAIGQRREVARNTIQTTLARLCERGWLQARQDGNAFVYRATRPRGSVVSKMVGGLVDRVFGGSVSGLVATIVESRSLSAEEAERIRRIIDAAERGGRK
jgi:BlaI family transcriptional regulator, penicillinase repressor